MWVRWGNITAADWPGLGVSHLGDYQSAGVILLKGDRSPCTQTDSSAQPVGIGESIHWPPVLSTGRQAVAVAQNHQYLKLYINYWGHLLINLVQSDWCIYYKLLIKFDNILIEHELLLVSNFQTNTFLKNFQFGLLNIVEKWVLQLVIFLFLLYGQWSWPCAWPV